MSNGEYNPLKDETSGWDDYQTMFSEREIEALTALFIRACEIKNIDVTEEEIDRAFRVFAKIRWLNNTLQDAIDGGFTGNEGFPIYVTDAGEIVLIDSHKSLNFN